MAGPADTPAWRFAVLPLAALLLALWLTRGTERPLDACLGQWRLDRRDEGEMIDVVAVGERAVAIYCLADAGTYSFVGTVLAERPESARLPLGALPAARANPSAVPAEDAAGLIDAAILARYGCRVRPEAGLVPPVATRLPVVERVAVPRTALECGSG